MKTETQLETVMVFPRAVAIAVSDLKQRLQHDYERIYPGLGEIVRIVLDEEEAHSWELSSFPHLLFPDLVQAHLETLGLGPADTRHERILASPIALPHSVAAIC